jgi:hypothetical protein
MVICTLQDPIVLLRVSPDRGMSYLNAGCSGRLPDAEKNICFYQEPNPGL